MAYVLWERILALVLGVLCMALNSIEIYLIIKNRKLMKTFELILLSLAFAVLIVGLSISTLAICSICDKEDYLLNRDRPFTYVIFTMKVFALTSSITNIFAISVERLMAVKSPLKHAIYMTCQKAKRLIAFVWLLNLISCIVFTVLQRLCSHTDSNGNDMPLAGIIYTSAIMILLFGVIFTAIYVYIVWKVILQRDEFDRRFGSNTVGQTEDFKLFCKIARERTLVLTCCLVVVTYVGCTYPVAITSIMSHVRNQQQVTGVLILFIVNSALDPFIYFLKVYMKRNFRQQFYCPP